MSDASAPHADLEDVTAVTVAEVNAWLGLCKPTPQAAYGADIIAATQILEGASSDEIGSYLVERALAVPQCALLSPNNIPGSHSSASSSMTQKAIESLTADKSPQKLDTWLRCFLHDQAIGVSLLRSVDQVWEVLGSIRKAAADFGDDTLLHDCLLAASCFGQHHEDIRALYRVLVDGDEGLQLIAAERPRTPTTSRRKRSRSPAGSDVDHEGSPRSTEALRIAKSSRKDISASPSPPISLSQTRLMEAAADVQLSQAPPPGTLPAVAFTSALPPKLVQMEYAQYVKCVENTFSGVRSCRQVSFVWCNVFEAYLGGMHTLQATAVRSQGRALLQSTSVLDHIQQQLEEAKEAKEYALEAVHLAAASLAHAPPVIDLSGSQSPPGLLRGASPDAPSGGIQEHLMLLMQVLADEQSDSHTLRQARSVISEHKAAEASVATAARRLATCQARQRLHQRIFDVSTALMHSLTTHRDCIRRVLASCMDSAVEYVNEKLQATLSALHSYVAVEMTRAQRMRQDHFAAVQQLQEHDDVYGDDDSVKRSTLQRVVVEIGAAQMRLKQHLRDAMSPFQDLARCMVEACPTATCELWSGLVERAMVSDPPLQGQDEGGVADVARDSVATVLQLLRQHEMGQCSDGRVAAFPCVQLAPHSPLHRPPGESSLQTPEAATGQPGFSPRTPAPSAPPGSGGTSHSPPAAAVSEPATELGALGVGAPVLQDASYEEEEEEEEEEEDADLGGGAEGVALEGKGGTCTLM
jgi:hypothetical protein